MSKHAAWIALPLALAAAGLGAGSSAAYAGAKPVTCEIRVADAGGARTLTAIATSSAAVAGSYQFDLSANTGGGTADSSQGDDVSLAAGETMLSSTSLNAGSKFTAKLTVTWPGGSTTCAKQG